MPSNPSPAGAGGVGGAAYDVQAVAEAARRQDPGLPPETAALLAGQARDLLRAHPEQDAPALARALMADNPDAGATPANVVAVAAIAHCEDQGLGA